MLDKPTHQLSHCKTCGKEISKSKKVSWNEYYKRKYCCHRCSTEDLELRKVINEKNELRYNENNRVSVTCKVCGKEFIAQKSKMTGRKRFSTCDNPECRKKHHSAIAQKGFDAARDTMFLKKEEWATKKRITVVCGCGCGTSFETTKTRLNSKVNGQLFLNRDHYEKWFRGENCTSWQGGDVRYYGPNWNIQKARARKRDKCCQICGLSKDVLKTELTVHHIEPFRKFNNYAEANKLSNLTCLCPDCHLQVHGILNFNDISGMEAIQLIKDKNWL